MSEMKHTPPNSGKRGRDVLAEAVNRASDSGAKSILCRPQYAADVIEQRDDLVAALEACPLPSVEHGTQDFYKRFYDWYNGAREAALLKARG